MTKSRSDGWKPDEIKVNYVRKEIEQEFDRGVIYDAIDDLAHHKFSADTEIPHHAPIKPNEGLLSDYAKIGAFLLDQDAVTRQLKKLNAVILQKCNGNPDESHVKVLREILENELAKFGFHPIFGKAINVIDPAGFRATLTHGLILKDIILGGYPHGEFTHAIQWLIIAWQQAESHFLDHSVIDIFKQLGSDESIYVRRMPHINFAEVAVQHEHGIWDLLVDHTSDFTVTSINIKLDFRVPETLNDFISTSQEQDLSALKSLINKRYSKRFEERRKEHITGKTLESKYTEPQRLYHRSTIKGVIEPNTSNIDPKQSHKKK